MNNEWIYDWNLASPPAIRAGTRVLLNDETLRDGLQNPSVFDPPIEEKFRILHLMEALGIETVSIGFPGAPAPPHAHTPCSRPGNRSRQIEDSPELRRAYTRK